MCEPLARVKFAEIDVRIGANADCSATRLAREQQRQSVWFGVPAQRLFRVAWFTTAHVWLQPDLQEVDRILWRWIELAVQHAATGADVLQVAGFDDATIAHAVLVFHTRLR